MDRMGLRTVIIIILCSLFRLSALDYVDVNSESNCSYIKYYSKIWYECPKGNGRFFLSIRARKRAVTLECTEETRTSSFADEIIPKLDVTQFISLELLNCYLNASIYDLLKKLNMNKVKYLTFTIFRLKKDAKIILNVTKELFEHMESIEYLKFDSVKLNLSVDFLENTPNLRELTLKSNGLTQISKYFDHVPKLESLDLSSNKIDIEEDGFSKLLRLVNISLQSNKMHEIHRYLFKNNKLLEHIKLDYNIISALPDYLFANLTSLQTIDLSFNHLSEIPEHTFSNCGKLRDLLFKGNSLSTIPEKTFLNLTSLKKLDISNNLLETLSDQLFSSLDNLEELYVSSNLLTALDSDIFHNMGKLKILNLRRNNISFIHLLAFRGLKYSLIHLDLSNNQLNNIYHNNHSLTPFHECLNLEELILRRNKIRDYESILQVQRYWAPDTTDANRLNDPVKKIDLSYNRIKNLKIEDFMYPMDLNLEVDLTHNGIQYVDIEYAFKWAQYIERYISDMYDTSRYTWRTNIIHLDDNPIACDCSNKYLFWYNNYKETMEKTIVDIKLDDITCSDHKNIFITDINPYKIGCSDVKGCPSQCTCTYKYNDKAVVIDCSFKNKSAYPELSIKRPEYQQIILNLSGNLLNAGPVEDSNYEDVTYLDLSRNHISEMTWIPPNIKELNLEENRLHKLDSHFVNSLKNTTSLVQIHLGKNSWDCNCDLSDLHKFLLQNPDKVNSSNVYCHNSTTQLVKLTELCKTSELLTVLSPIVLTILLCFAVALALYYRYQKEIKIYLYAQNLCLWFVTEDELDKDKTYDVFISYANQDENFVIDYLLPELEHGQTPFKVCVHMRDWIPGELITTQVINSVKDSRRTLVVLSNNFVDSMWGKLEFRTAHTEAISEGRARVIVVIYGDLNEDKLDDELKCYIKTNTYVKWGDKYFWNKLKYALPHSRPQVEMIRQTDEEFDLTTTSPSPKNTNTPLVTLNVSL